MFKALMAIALSWVALPALAWNSPKEAVEKFVEFDFNGGRLLPVDWAAYLEKYLHINGDYDEPGWDMVTVIDGYSVGQPRCTASACAVSVKYRLRPIRLLNDRSVIPHRNGGTQSVRFTVKNKDGAWKVEPDPKRFFPDYPRISDDTYQQWRRRG
jgi:hypothetical protein